MGKRLAAILLSLFLAQATQAEPDQGLLGKPLGYPVGTGLANWYANPYRVGSWSAIDQVPGVRVARVQPAAQPTALPRMDVPPAIRWRYRNVGYTLGDYLERQRATGLLLLKDGRIVAEHYRYGRKDDARFLSFSMAKSITALLIGIAQAQGHIASLDDRADAYAKELAGTAYGATTLRHLLRMSSGLVFSERYDGNDDVARLGRAFTGAPEGTLAVLRTITERHSPAGETFAYAGAETDALGRALRGATGRSLTQLAQQWLWQPMGAEHEAFWRLGRDGQEGAHGHFSASLRDWARLGLLLANDGRVRHASGGERQVVPHEYLLDATDAARQPAAFQPRRATPYTGYGYQFWLLPMKTRTFALQGIHGQAVYVQPASGIVMVHTAAFEAASARQDAGPAQERDALWRGVLASLGGSVD